MLDVMLCLPKSSWGVVLDQVARKIGTRALRKIIVQACDDSESHSPGNSAFEPSPPGRAGTAMLTRMYRETQLRPRVESVIGGDTGLCLNSGFLQSIAFACEKACEENYM